MSIEYSGFLKKSIDLYQNDTKNLFDTLSFCIIFCHNGYIDNEARAAKKIRIL